MKMMTKVGGDMKKAVYMILPFSILANATLLGLGIECLLNLLGFSMAISLDSAPSYPRFIPFCAVLGAVALLGLIAMLVLNFKVSETLNLTRPILIFEYISAFVLSVPAVKLWGMLFDLLQKTF